MIKYLRVGYLDCETRREQTQGGYEIIVHNYNEVAGQLHDYMFAITTRNQQNAAKSRYLET